MLGGCSTSLVAQTIIEWSLNGPEHVILKQVHHIQVVPKVSVDFCLSFIASIGLSPVVPWVLVNSRLLFSWISRSITAAIVGPAGNPTPCETLVWSHY